MMPNSRLSLGARALGRLGRGAFWRSPLLWVGALVLFGFALRLYRLGGPVLRWDEGWSLAHASLPWSDLLRVAAEDRHPPLYMLLLKLWLLAGLPKGGITGWGIRLFSAFWGVLAIPTSYVAAREWAAAWGGKYPARLGILAAGYAAIWPLLVYYGQVARMYSLSAFAVLLTAWCLLRGLRTPSWHWDVALLISTLGSLYTLYHTAWAIAGVWAYGLLAQPRRWKRFFLLGLGVLALYLPWLFYAYGTLTARLEGSSGGTGALWQMVPLLKACWSGLAFAYGTRPGVEWLLGGLLLLGVAARPWRHTEIKGLLLPILAVGWSMLGVAYSVRTLWFAVRHLVPASALFGLVVAWALDRLAQRAKLLLPIALILLAFFYWPSSAQFVYEKTLEVTDPFDPTEDYRYLAQHAGPQDFVFFNVLARAGWYEALRSPHDAPWFYAQRWEPIIEPMDRLIARLTSYGRAHHRLWFVFHMGDYGPNAPLVGWLNDTLYPAGGEWQGNTLYRAYATPQGQWRKTPIGQTLGGIRLESAEWTDGIPPEGAVTLSLMWQATQPISQNLAVFVHAVDESGHLVAQHDGIPSSGRAPTPTWASGQTIRDRHGLFLPEGAPKTLFLYVGLYDPQTGQRLTAPDGQDKILIGEVHMNSPDELPAP